MEKSFEIIIKELDKIIEDVNKSMNIDKDNLENIVECITNITNFLLKNEDFIEEIDTYNIFLEEMLGAMEMNNVLLLNDIYEYKFKEIVLDLI